MDIIIVILIFFAIVIVMALRYPQRVSAFVKLPFGKLRVSGSNQSTSQKSIRAKDILSRKGGVLFDDSIGRGIEAEGIDAEGNIMMSSRGPSDSNPQRSVFDGVMKNQHLNASQISAGRDVHITQANTPSKLPIDGLDERRGKADWALLSKLWSLVNTDYIDQLNTETQIGMIRYEEFEQNIEGYIELRRKPQNKFHHTQLEQEFNDFDQALERYVESIKPAFTASPINEVWWLLSERREARLIDHRWIADEEYKIVEQRENEFVRQSIDLLNRSKHLVGQIREIVPDFFIG